MEVNIKFSFRIQILDWLGVMNNVKLNVEM
jgi:hypothetical protein